jgi:hypothetical protein
VRQTAAHVFSLAAIACASLSMPVMPIDAMPSVYVKTGKGQGHGKPGTRSKAERNARKAKRRQRAKERR